MIGSDAEGTAEFVTLVDKMFDCLNVSSCEGIKKRKYFRVPYTNSNDWRLKVGGAYAFCIIQ